LSHFEDFVLVGFNGVFGCQVAELFYFIAEFAVAFFFEAVEFVVVIRIAAGFLFGKMFVSGFGSGFFWRKFVFSIFIV